jgi:TDG/mug DNA glycosylase family protein
MIDHPIRPTKQQLAQAINRTVPNIIAPNLKVLFCGINPGLYSAAVSHHFARPGNRFWPALFAGGFTPRLFSPFEERELLTLGYGITNIVGRATATADQLSPDELRSGAKSLRRKILRSHPKILAIVGVGAFRIAFNQPRATFGLQTISIGPTKLWLLPNPSGLNAHYQPPALARHFNELRVFSEK